MNKICIACDRNENATPLIPFDFKGGKYWICPQHLPILIHKPAQLAGKLPGAEDLKPADSV
ncbi:MAG: hypothetical protein PVF33_00130 [Candidatus Latescibacterota bacterium]|jgi:hypothetical protein